MYFFNMRNQPLYQILELVVAHESNSVANPDLDG